MSTPTVPTPRPQSLRPDQIPITLPQALARYHTETGKILPRRITGLSAKQQRAVTRTIKRGRNMLTMQ